jgi:aromatic ring-opening dioxygenase catalytic subunit (LigB family)
MATLVGAYGAAHRPGLPRAIAERPGELEDERCFHQVREELAAAAPDLIIELSSDHFTNFYQRNMPTFGIGMFTHGTGPERNQKMPSYTVPSDRDAAEALVRHALDSSFDVSYLEELVFDHSFLVPLHFLTPEMTTPVIPIHVNGVAPPLPTADRCRAFGGMLRSFIEQLDSSVRVAILASGSFALEVGGPKVGWTDQAWVDAVQQAFLAGQYDAIAAEATHERMAVAGNASGEVLNWFVLSGAVGDARPEFIETHNGNGYGAWRPTGAGTPVESRR